MKLVKDIMVNDVITSKPDEKLSNTIKKMEKYNVKEIPVVKDGKLVGMVTFFDVLDLIKYPNSKVSNAIISSPSISEKDSIEDAILTMIKTGFEAIPVVKDGKVVGIISEYDILKEYTKSEDLKKYKVRDAMVKTDAHLYLNDKIGKARRVMRIERLDRIPVVDKKQRVIGIVSLIDIIRMLTKPQKKVRMGYRVGDLNKVFDLPVKNMIRKTPILTDNMGIKEALNKLLKIQIKGAPVVNNNNKLEGIFYRFKVLKLISKNLMKKGVWVRFPSCDLHPDSVEILKEKISHELKKLKALMPSLEEISVRIKQVHGKTTDHIYELNMKFSGPGLNKNVKTSGYNILYVVEDGLSKIEKQLDKKKKRYNR